MNDTVCAVCKHGFQEGEQAVPVTRRTQIGAINGSRLPEVIEPKREAVHPGCFDPQTHNYAG